MRVLILLVMLLTALAGCATAPTFETAGVDPTLTPGAVLANAPATLGRRVQWGGVIVAIRNLRDRTQLEVLGYPLDRSGEPDQSASPQGRFLILERGYLEPVDYAAGRTVTAVGTVQGVERGRVGEADYRYPVMEASQLHLWPKETYYPQRDSNVHFGIGVIVH